MALTNVIVPAFPDVPEAPGVPAVLRGISTTANKAIVLASGLASIVRMFLGPQWGIFKAGAPVLVGNSVLGVDFRSEWRISDYPVEKGAFATYDKVAMPFDVRITFAVDGSGSFLSSLIPGGAAFLAAANRTAMLTLLAACAKSLDLYDVITPEMTYANCNIVHFDYRREARGGATLIRVDVWLVEIREAPAGKFSQTKTEAAADPVNTGPVQAKPIAAPASTGGGTGFVPDRVFLPRGAFT